MRPTPGIVSNRPSANFLLISGFLLAQTLASLANPTGGQVVSGTANINTAPGTVTINQATSTAIINWQGFSIASGELTRFQVPTSASATLNRVTGGNISSIYGTLQSNGQLYLINPNGIVVGASGRIDTAGFVASTLNFSDTQFNQRGDLNFSGSSTAGVTNQGTIKSSAGDVYLIATQVNNAGTITAPQGTVGLAAGSQVLLQKAGDQHLFVQVGSTAKPQAKGITNTGAIRSATAELKAAGGNAYALAINNSGNIAATGITSINGQVYLTGDGADITNSGSISAKQANGNGGTIVVDGSGASPAATTVLNSGTLNASATAAGGSGGSVTLKNKGGTTIHSGKIIAQGGQGGVGGNAEISGAQVQFTGTVDLTAPGGATGDLLLDPGTLNVITGGGSNLTASTVDPTTVDATLGTANLTLDADTNITVTNAINWTSSNTLTLKTNTPGSTIDLNAPITSYNSGGLTINAAAAGDVISATSGVSVGSFILQNGFWNQENASLPYFYATSNFALQGGTFLRVTGGTGAVGSPYQITDVFGLQGLASPSGSLLGVSAELENDIYAGFSYSWNGNAGFVPIGTIGTPFTGTFNGQGHEINYLDINRPNSGNVGLFGATGPSAVVENVGLAGASISGGNVAGIYDYVGGLVAYNQGAITNCYVTGSVSSTGGTDVGGLAGYNFGGAISACYNAATVSDYGTNAYVGGLAGGIDSTSTISNSYNIGAVSGYNAGGIAGFNYGTISNSYSTGYVAGTADVGGLVAYNGGTISNSFWDTSTSGINSPTGGVGGGANSGVTGDPTATLMTAAIYSGAGWNIGTDPTPVTGNTWVIFDGSTRPMLAMEYSTTIDNAHQLQLIGLNATTLGATYTLNQYVDASGTTNSPDVWGSTFDGGGAGFVPIGNSSTPFTGTFNGQGNQIYSLFINLPSATYVGLFGLTSSVANINNVGLTNVNVTGKGGTSFGGPDGGVGALVGQNNGTVSNSYSTGTVNGYYYVGGLVGENNGGPGTGIITNSYSMATVTAGNGASMVGGLAGDNDYGGSILSSYSMGAVNAGTGAQAVGGLVGFCGGPLSGCYSTGAVTADSGSSAIGGLFGINNDTVSEVYSSGAVTVIGTGISEVGGLVGLNSTSGGITNAYSTGAVSVPSGSTLVGGFVGQNEHTIANAYSSGPVTVFGGPDMGGFAGYNTGTISHSFWDTTTSGIASPGGSGDAGVTGGPTATLMTAATYSGAGWSIGTDPTSDAWVIFDGQTRPMLAMEYSTTIVTGHQLQLLGLNTTTLGGNYSVVNNTATNIDLTGTTNPSDVWGGLGFVPIGNSSTPFTGTFNGGFYQISNLYINAPNAVGVGLFGEISGATVQYVNLTNALITGGQSVGGVVGYNNSGSVYDCSSSGVVNLSGNLNGGSYYLGGLVGYNTGGTINYGSSSATVNAGTVGASACGSVGGLVGTNLNSATISNSSSTGAVNALIINSFQIGGLVGTNYNNSSISHSYSTGIVTTSADNAQVGGLAGNCNGGATISNCYSAGAVNVPGNGAVEVGGLVGELDGGGTISFSYSTAIVTAGSNALDVGGLVGGWDHGTAGLVETSFATGSVTTGSGSANVGGLEGYFGGAGTVEACYATGAVTGSSGLGGLLGRNDGTVEACYSTGQVTSVSSTLNVGGLVGENNGTVQNCYWAQDTALNTGLFGVGSSSSNTGATPETLASLMQQSTFVPAGVGVPNWDFTNTWTTNGNTTTPQLLSVTPGAASTPPPTLDTLSGTAYADSGGTPTASGTTIDLIFNGTLLGSTTTSGTGGFSFSISPADLTGGILLTDPADKGNTYYQAGSPAGAIAGVDLWGGTLRVMADPASNTALGQAAGSLSAVGINYSVLSGNLTTNTGVNMAILGNYTADGPINVSGNFTTGPAAVVTGSPSVNVTATGSANLSGTISGIDVDVYSPHISLNGATVTTTDPGVPNFSQGLQLGEFTGNSQINIVGSTITGPSMLIGFGSAGVATANQVSINNSTLNLVQSPTPGSSPFLYIDGTATTPGSPGVSITNHSAIIAANGGDVYISGTGLLAAGSDSTGVLISGSTLSYGTSASPGAGSLDIEGYSDAGNTALTPNSVFANNSYGVQIVSSTLISYSTDKMQIHGTAYAANNANSIGVDLSGTSESENLIETFNGRNGISGSVQPESFRTTQGKANQVAGVETSSTQIEANGAAASIGIKSDTHKTIASDNGVTSATVTNVSAYFLDNTLISASGSNVVLSVPISISGRSGSVESSNGNPNEAYTDGIFVSGGTAGATITNSGLGATLLAGLVLPGTGEASATGPNVSSVGVAIGNAGNAPVSITSPDGGSIGIFGLGGTMSAGPSSTFTGFADGVDIGGANVSTATTSSATGGGILILAAAGSTSGALPAGSSVYLAGLAMYSATVQTNTSLAGTNQIPNGGSIPPAIIIYATDSTVVKNLSTGKITFQLGSPGDYAIQEDNSSSLVTGNLVMGNFYSQFTTYAPPSLVAMAPTTTDFNNFLTGTSQAAETIKSQGIVVNPAGKIDLFSPLNRITNLDSVLVGSGGFYLNDGANLSIDPIGDSSNMNFGEIDEPPIAPVYVVAPNTTYTYDFNEGTPPPTQGPTSPTITIVIAPVFNTLNNIAQIAQLQIIFNPEGNGTGLGVGTVTGGVGAGGGEKIVGGAGGVEGKQDWNTGGNFEKALAQKFGQARAAELLQIIKQDLLDGSTVNTATLDEKWVANTGLSKLVTVNGNAELFDGLAQPAGNASPFEGMTVNFVLLDQAAFGQTH